MIRLCRNWFGVISGLHGQDAAIFRHNNEKKVVVMHRRRDGGPKDSVMVDLNFSSESFNYYKASFPRAGVWKLRFMSDSVEYDPDSSQFIHDIETMEGEYDGLNNFVALGIPPYSVLVYS